MGVGPGRSQVDRAQTMKTRRTARELEMAAASARPLRHRRAPAPESEALAMLVRRGLQPRTTSLDLPFPANLEEAAAERLAEKLRHYAFRLFFRGALKAAGEFVPDEVTDYVSAAQCRVMAESMANLGLAVQASRGRYRLLQQVSSFGPTLEWYVARELGRRYGFDVAVGVKFRARGIGGDLDVVAAAEGRLVYLELKSSPPKHLSEGEISAFFDRVRLLRPDITLFAIDTGLRLSDKVVPMLADELSRRRAGAAPIPRRVERELWALTPHIYAVNSKPDLIANIGRAIAEGLFALAPPL
jgi:hypothetical protein